jgi:hypothetical protein
MRRVAIATVLGASLSAFAFSCGNTSAAPTAPSTMNAPAGAEDDSDDSDASVPPTGPTQVECAVQPNGAGCGCGVEAPGSMPPASASTACSAALATNGICCASEGWPASGTCACQPFACEFVSGPLGGPGNCSCGPGVFAQLVNVTVDAGNESQAPASCSGALCCTDPVNLGCNCRLDNSTGDTCRTSTIGQSTASAQVPSCSAANLTCPPGSRGVSVCSTGIVATPDAGLGTACDDSTQLACAGGCVDPMTDKGNCGACGVACAGSCVAGECLVTIEEGSSKTPFQGLVVDATNAYFVNGGNLVKMPLGGGSMVTLATDIGVLGQMAVDSTNLYWTTQDSPTGASPSGGPPIGTVNKVPIAGGPPVVLASGQDDSFGIAVDATTVYWTNQSRETIQSTAAGSVMEIPINATASDSPTVLAANVAGPAFIAVDANGIYWNAQIVYNATTPCENCIVSMPLAGGTPTSFCNGVIGISAMVIDSQNLYVASQSTTVTESQVTQIPLPSSPSSNRSVALGQDSRINALAVSGTSVYWTTIGDLRTIGSIAKVPIGGGTASQLTRPVQTFEPAGLAVNANAIYWTGCDLAPVTMLLLPPGSAPCYGFGGFNKATPE